MAQFKSLARVYRPQTFSDLVGQEVVVRSLSQGFDSGVLTQAYLFSGERGVGKTTVARILAKAINCAKGPTSSPCLQCPPCLDIARGQSPDVLEMDGASHTSVEDVRSLRESIRYAPLTSRARIIIIDEVHMLSTSAFNALLKTLEEPPPHVVFILATTEAHKIPETVRSRCQHFRFRLLSLSEIQDRLSFIGRSEGITIPPATLNLLARAANGSLRDALSILDQVLRIGGPEMTTTGIAELLGVTDKVLEEALLSALLKGDLKETLRISRTILDSGVDPRAQIHSIAQGFRDILHSTLEGEALTAPRYGWTQESLSALPLSPPPNLFFLEQALSVLLRGEIDLGRSPQPAITFELLLARICHLKAVVPLADLLAELENSGQPSSPKPHLPSGFPSKIASPPSHPPDREPRAQAPAEVPKQVPHPAVGPSDSPQAGPLDLRIPADWPRAISRLSHEHRSMLESARILHIEQGTITLDTGNPFFNNRIAQNSESLARALTEAVKSTELLRLDVSSGGKSPSAQTAPPPPLVSEALSLFGSEVIGTRKGREAGESKGKEATDVRP